MSAPLPTPPEGVNPYAFYTAVAKAAMYVVPPEGLEIRVILLFVMQGLVVLISFLYLGLTLLDYRRREKSLWLWGIVRRPSGRFIVGNQQLLEPLLTLLASAIFIAHLQDEFAHFFQGGDQSQTGAWRVAPWTALFLQCWIVSWASLQSFMLTSGEQNPVMRHVTAWMANTVFLGIGGASAICLVVFDSLSARASRRIWSSYLEVGKYLAPFARDWVAGDAINSTVVAGATLRWNNFLEEYVDSLKLTVPLLATFAATPLLTTFVNMGSLGVILLVRKQIRLGYNNFGAATMPGVYTLPHIDVEATTPPAPVAISFSPATPAVGEQETFARDSHQFRQSSESAVSHTSSVFGGEKNGSRTPSRSKVRALAAKEDGGIVAERAKNLQLLQRAESELIVTGLAIAIMSLSFATLSIWVIVVRNDFANLPWFATEATLFLGNFIYATVSLVSLSCHVYTTWVYLPAAGYLSSPYDSQNTTPCATANDSSDPETSLRPPGTPLGAPDCSFGSILAQGPPNDSGSRTGWLTPTRSSKERKSEEDSDGTDSELKM